MESFNQFTIPLGKYIDPNTLGELELIRYKVSDDEKHDTLYLIRDVKNSNYYCCYEPNNSSEHNYHQSDAKIVMQNFLDNELGVSYRMEIMTPKSGDWLITHYLARVYIPQK
jgi:hypothetical protein